MDDDEKSLLKIKLIFIGCLCFTTIMTGLYIHHKTPKPYPETLNVGVNDCAKNQSYWWDNIEEKCYLHATLQGCANYTKGEVRVKNKATATIIQGNYDYWEICEDNLKKECQTTGHYLYEIFENSTITLCWG